MRPLNFIWLISSWTKISVSFAALKNENVILFAWRIFFKYNIFYTVVAIKKKKSKKSICAFFCLPLSSSQIVCASKSFYLAFLEYFRAWLLLHIICLVFPGIHETYFLVFNMLQDHLEQHRFHCSRCYVTQDTGGYLIDICYTEMFCDPSCKISSVLFCTSKIR